MVKKVNSQKRLTVVECWFTEGKKTDAKPILSTELPTGAVTGAGSLWPEECVLAPYQNAFGG